VQGGVQRGRASDSAKAVLDEIQQATGSSYANRMAQLVKEK
jgi:hypothetical protein